VPGAVSDRDVRVEDGHVLDRSLVEIVHLLDPKIISECYGQDSRLALIRGIKS
jgi:hypothetical protein